MASRKKLRSRTDSMVLLIVLLLLPAALQAQRTRTVIVQPPTGWFGVRISDQAMVDERGNAFFDSYPVITSVDSGSPAASAGVRPGDVLLSFNSHDMRGGTVELSKWLRAGAPFVLKVRRNDATRTIRGTLGRRPDNWEQNMIVELSVPEIMKQRTGAIARQPMPMAGMIRTRVPVPEPLPSVLAPALGYGGGVYPFAGAGFIAFYEERFDCLGVKHRGGFVTNVVGRSLAGEAWHRGGAVVHRGARLML